MISEAIIFTNLIHLHQVSSIMADDGWGDVPEADVDTGESSYSRGGGGGGHFADAGGDAGCRKCGEEGHFARDCPQRVAGDNRCRNCRQV